MDSQRDSREIEGESMDDDMTTLLDYSWPHQNLRRDSRVFLWCYSHFNLQRKSDTFQI